MSWLIANAKEYLSNGLFTISNDVHAWVFHDLSLHQFFLFILYLGFIDFI